MTTGTLFGIGVGPGDPELIPLKAVRILKSIQLIFTAASSKNDYSMAVEIAKPHIPNRTTVQKLAFPMSREKAVIKQAWRKNARRVATALEAGLDAAFLTLGDPLTYSTYGYILRCLQAEWPHLTIHTVPGITSYQAAAAVTNRPLVEGEESLLIMSGVHGGQKLERMTEKPDNVVFLKAYRNVEGIRHALEDADMLTGSMAVTNCSREDEEIHKDLKILGQKPPNYWTLIIAGQHKNGTPEE
jgi:precorrin-2/cobalt-factor-2 C20-methyltransferase